MISVITVMIEYLKFTHYAIKHVLLIITRLLGRYLYIQCFYQNISLRFKWIFFHVISMQKYFIRIKKKKLRTLDLDHTNLKKKKLL